MSSKEQTNVNASIEAEIALIEQWESKPLIDEITRIENKMNRAVFPITLKGYSKAFVRVTRKYNADKDRTTLSVSTLAYNLAGDKVDTMLKTLSVKARGNVAYVLDSSPENGIITANWRVANAMDSSQVAIVEYMIKKANNVDYPQWGKNAASEYVASLKEQRGFTA